MRENSKNGVVYYTFDHIEKTGLVKHAFSTRLGGVSEGSLGSMNLGFSRGDDRENVLKNYSIFCEAIGIKFENVVFSAQTHSSNVIKVTRENRRNNGDDIFRDVDGLVTDESETALVTLYADCVPVFLLDPIKKVIGLVHAGWRGSVGKIAKCAVDMMCFEYGVKACDILAGIGPSIGPCCFETDEPVYSIFEERQYGRYITACGNGKKKIDLWEINKQILADAGVLSKNIEIAEICTKCNNDIFHSHRHNGNERGSLAAFMELINGR